ncbi:hypothetical protein [Streptomyces sp. NPDC058045]|uniref:hypothetical protein n=1 Tax=Streptomyces sp. NPDC058045 TaxID=3346311 RepID=UPI0036E13D38
MRGEDALVVCTAGRRGGTLANRFPVTVQLAADGGKSTVGALPRLSALDGYGATGRWLVAAEVRRDGKVFRTYDARGRQVGEALPGRLHAVDGRYAVFTRGECDRTGCALADYLAKSGRWSGS